MANEHKIDINKRNLSGKKGIKQLRRDGYIPGIYYSPNSDTSTPIFISKSEFNLLANSLNSPTSFSTRSIVKFIL